MAARILFLAANPDTTTPLHLPNEYRDIMETLRAVPHRDDLQTIFAPAVRPGDLQPLLLSHQPQIVHFSGHGSSEGKIILHDPEDRPWALGAPELIPLFTTLKDNIRLVLLNACNTSPLAKALSQVIDCVIGMNAPITDPAAITFAVSFYRALGFGRSIQEAFELGREALALHHIPEPSIPALLVRSAADAHTISFFPVAPSIQPEPAAGTPLRLMVVLRLALHVNDWTPRVKDLLINSVAQFLRLAPAEIDVVRVEKGSVKITISLPSEYAKLLDTACNTRDPNLTKLLHPLALADPRDAPLADAIRAAGSRNWLLSNPEVWCAFAVVLYFAKLVHQTFHVIATMHTESLASELSQLLETGAIALPKQLAFQDAWSNYDQHYQLLLAQWAPVFSQDYHEVADALHTLDGEYAFRLNRRSERCDNFFRSITKGLNAYSSAHKEAEEIAFDAQRLFSKLNHREGATEFYGQVAQLSRTAKAIAVHSDGLLTLLIDVIVER